MAENRISVRSLVEFTLHGEDLYPSGGALRDMQEGMYGHKGRQGDLGEGWQAEVPLSLLVEEDEENTLLISGRMDAFLDGDEPMVEEIKLWQHREHIEKPFPAHVMQASVYAHMLCEQRAECRGVGVRVAYVDRKGRVQASFDEFLSRAECKERFCSVLFPYLQRMRVIRQHRRGRDASLDAVGNPYGTFRPGQREMAAQVFTAIQRQRRLFASMPTGTGKSFGALFPAIKALGRGLTEQVFYLTARTTQRKAALEVIRRVREDRRVRLWTLVIDAKDKICPDRVMCHPDYCPQAKGHFLRDADAITEMLQTEDWSPEAIRAMAQKHNVCPFEFSLALAEVADVIICDYNYALDPAVHIQRIFDQNAPVTLLIDEAHNLLPRLRSMLSGAVDGPRIRRMRTVVGHHAGRSHPVYKAMSAVLKALKELPEQDGEACVLTELPSDLDYACMDLADALLNAQMDHIPWEESGEPLVEMLSPLIGFIRARKREEEGYAWIREGRKTPRITAHALDVGTYFAEVTAKKRGVVCFSATFAPLQEMRRLLGGDAETDACLELPSPFPPENLRICQTDVDTRYHRRADSVDRIAQEISAMVQQKLGRYMVFFPSFEYMQMVSEALDIPHQCQQRSMDDEARAEFLSGYVSGGPEVTSLCVLGGIFAEGIDLPGDALDGVAVVGVGLPQKNIFQDALAAYYQRTLGDGFRYAYVIPGMQKVAQAVGRVIRSETDVGMALLMDERYRSEEYRRLLPAHWRIHWEERHRPQRG